MKKLIMINLDAPTLRQTYLLSDLDSKAFASLTEESAEGTLFIFESEEESDETVVMCPGGGFLKTNLVHEGFGFAPWFTSRKINYAVLKYRMPAGCPDHPLEDIQRSLKFLRSEYVGRSRRLGVMGASIGGYLAAYASTMLSDTEKPDFQILMYALVDMSDGLVHTACRDRMFGEDLSPLQSDAYFPLRHLSASTPAAFIVAVADDTVVTPQNSFAYAAELQKVGGDVTFHLYPSGGHGFGCNEEFLYHEEWLRELHRWMTIKSE